jgi:glycosyltransferase involved in cell wall biosynthesis
MKSYYNPLVSIIIPNYNSEKYLSQTLDSLYNQTYTNFQVVYVNDGSNDNSEQIIKNYLRTNQDVYLFQKNKGVLRLAETLNYGLSRCDGELVTMFPSDDLWPNYKLADQINYFTDESVVMVHGKMLLIDQFGNHLKIAKQPPKNYFARHNYPINSILPFLLKENFISQPTCLIRKSILVSIGGYLQPENNFAEDYPTHLELAKYGKIIYIDNDKIYAFYRQHENQMTKNHFPKMVESDCELILNFTNTLSGSIKADLNITPDFIANIIKRKKSIIPYMEAKRLISINQYKLSIQQIKFCILKSPLNLKFRLFIFILFKLFNIKISFLNLNK